MSIQLSQLQVAFLAIVVLVAPHLSAPNALLLATLLGVVNVVPVVWTGYLRGFWSRVWRNR